MIGEVAHLGGIAGREPGLEAREVFGGFGWGDAGEFEAARVGQLFESFGGEQPGILLSILPWGGMDPATSIFLLHPLGD